MLPKSKVGNHIFFQSSFWFCSLQTNYVLEQWVNLLLYPLSSVLNQRYIAQAFQRVHDSLLTSLLSIIRVLSVVYTIVPWSQLKPRPSGIETKKSQVVNFSGAGANLFIKAISTMFWIHNFLVSCFSQYKICKTSLKYFCSLIEKNLKVSADFNVLTLFFI